MGKKMLRHAREIFNLTGKIAIVTGGSRDLGKEIACWLGQGRSKGCHYSVGDMTLQRVLTK